MAQKTKRLYMKLTAKKAQTEFNRIRQTRKASV